MSKDVREILARGLTVSNRGSVMEFTDTLEVMRKIRIQDVSYDETSTVVTYTEVVRIPNNLPVKIWDKN